MRGREQRNHTTYTTTVREANDQHDLVLDVDEIDCTPYSSLLCACLDSSAQTPNLCSSAAHFLQPWSCGCLAPPWLSSCAHSQSVGRPLGARHRGIHCPACRQTSRPTRRSHLRAWNLCRPLRPRGCRGRQRVLGYFCCGHEQCGAHSKTAACARQRAGQ